MKKALGVIPRAFFAGLDLMGEKKKKTRKTCLFFCHVLIKKIHSQSIAPQGFAAFL